MNEWINHIEELSSIHHLSDVEKFIFAKQLFNGPADLFIEFESTANSWISLQAESFREFGRHTNSLLDANNGFSIVTIMVKIRIKRRVVRTKTRAQNASDVMVLGSLVASAYHLNQRGRNE